jgi:hypothetical protein
MSKETGKSSGLMGFMFKVYGLDAVNMGNDAKKGSCEDVLKDKKSANTAAARGCEQKIGKIMLIIHDDRERADTERFVRQPKNLVLMLPAASDTALERYGIMKGIAEATPLWLYLVIVICLTILILIFLIPFLTVLCVALYKEDQFRMKMVVMTMFSFSTTILLWVILH